MAASGWFLATTIDSTYGNIDTDNRTQTGAYIVNGKASDKYSNVFDILGNCFEWTTEYSWDNYFGSNTDS